MCFKGFLYHIVMYLYSVKGKAYRESTTRFIEADKASKAIIKFLEMTEGNYTDEIETKYVCNIEDIQKG